MTSLSKQYFLFCVFLIVTSSPLLLTPLIQQGKIEEARKLSEIIWSNSTIGHSAFITVPSKSGENENNLFFWLQPCRKGCNPKTTPFIIWLQGGPGAPGTFGAMTEVGNFWVDENTQLRDRTYSWCDEYNCLFVDQPVGSGFSFQTSKTGKSSVAEYTDTSKDAMEQVYQLLDQFYEVWSEYLPAPFYITGESYGGLYIPWLGKVIADHNKNGDGKKINLAGIAAGDPLVNGEYQNPTYASTLYGMGVIMLEERAEIESIMQKAVDNWHDCPVGFKHWNSVWNDNGESDVFKFFEMTGSRETANILVAEVPEMGHYGKWMSLPEVQRALHVDGRPTSDESKNFLKGVYDPFVESGDFCRNSSWVYARLLLDTKIDVMIYSSTSDPLLGPPTSEAAVVSVFDYAEKYMGTEGRKAKETYNAKRKVIWRIAESDRTPAGYAKCIDLEKRFCYAVVRNAGHETPAFQPKYAYDLIKRFIEARPFTKEGDRPVPDVPQCEGCAPFTGYSLPACNK